MTLPEGWREVNLGDVLPEEAMGPLKKALEEVKLGKVHPQEVHKKLVAALEPHRVYLMRKGVLVEYLAYWLECALTKGDL